MTEETATRTIASEVFDLNVLASSCPNGWVELLVEHFPGDSGPAGGTPQDPDSSIHVGRAWGLTADDFAGVDAALETLLQEDVEGFYALARKVPHRGRILMRIVPRSVKCPSCKHVVDVTPKLNCSGLANCHECLASFIAPVGLEEIARDA